MMCHFQNREESHLPSQTLLSIGKPQVKLLDTTEWWQVTVLYDCYISFTPISRLNPAVKPYTSYDSVYNFVETIVLYCIWMKINILYFKFKCCQFWFYLTQISINMSQSNLICDSKTEDWHYVLFLWARIFFHIKHKSIFPMYLFFFGIFQVKLLFFIKFSDKKCFKKA